MKGHSEVSFVPTDDICVIHLHQNGIGVENVALKVNQVDVKIADFTINAEYEYLSGRAPKSLFFRKVFPIVLTRVTKKPKNIQILLCGLKYVILY